MVAVKAAWCDTYDYHPVFVGSFNAGKVDVYIRRNTHTSWVAVQGDTEEGACETAWWRVVEYLCADIHRAKAALDVARLFDER